MQREPSDTPRSGCPEGGRGTVRFIRRPVVGLTAAFLLGTSVGLHAADVGWAVWGGAFACVCAAAIRLWSPRRSGSGMAPHRGRACDTLLLLAAAVLAGWVSASPRLRGAAPPSDWSAGGAPEAVEVSVVDDPVANPSVHGRLVRCWVQVRVIRVRTAEGEWQRPGFITTPMWWHGTPDGRLPRYGDHWLLHDVNWPAARADTQDAHWPRVFPRQATFVSGGHGSSFRTWCYAARARVAEHLTRGVEQLPEENGILQSLMVGGRGRLSRAVRDLGAATGTLHVFAISGQHVVIVTGLCILLLRAVRLSRVRWVWALGPVVIAYTVLTGAPASAVRACVMALVFLLAPSMGRRPDAASALCLSAVLIAAAAPAQIQDIGFIFSFVVVLGLIVWCPLIYGWLNAVVAPDPLALPEARGPRGIKHRMLRTLISVVAVSVAAWFASLPITAYYFERVTPVALLANLVVVPLAFLMVFSGCLSVVLGSVSNLFAEIYNMAAVTLIQWFLEVNRLLTRLPFSNIEIARPTAWQVWGYMLLATILTIWAWGAYGQRREPSPDPFVN